MHSDIAAPTTGQEPGQHEPGQYKYWAYRIAAAVVPLIPLPIAQALAQAIGVCLWAVMPAARRRADFNLRHIPELAQDEDRRRWAVRGVFRHLALNYLDLFRAGRFSTSRVLADWTIENQELFTSALAQGRGVILISAHLGNFEYAAVRLASMGVPLILPAERLKPERLFALACALRGHHGIHVVPADSTEAVRDLFAALRRGEVVLLAVDRDVLGTGVEVPLFGAPVRLPIGGVLLAQRSGAPVLWAHGWRESNGRARGAFLPVDQPADQADEPVGDLHGVTTRTRTRPRGKEALALALAPIAALLERQIAAHPEQWVAALTTMWQMPAADHEGGPDPDT